MIVLFILILYYLYDEIFNKYKINRTFKTKNAHQRSTHKNTTYQGVAVSNKYIFVIETKKISKYDKKSLKLLQDIDLSFDHANGGKVIDTKLYIFNNPANKNTLEIFDLDLKHKKSLNIKLDGSITWIDYFENNWWGMNAHYLHNGHKTRLILFDNNFNIKKQWKLPDKIIKRIYPYSISGGQYNKLNKLLYITGHDKKEIYVIKVNNILELVGIIYVPFTGQGISWYDNKLYGINRKNKTVIELVF